MPELIDHGRFNEFGVQLVAAYCQAFARWRESEEAAAKWAAPERKNASGRKAPKKAAPKQGEPPQVDRNALNDMRQLAKELGLGHSSLARIRKNEKNSGGAPPEAPKTKLNEMRNRLGVHPGGKPHD